MSDEGKPLEPEHIFKKLVWRNMLGISSSLEKSTTWTITGVAAIAGLLVGKLDSLSQSVATGGLRWGLIFFTVALIFGVVSKQIGVGVANGLEAVSKMEALVLSADGQKILSLLQTNPKQLMHDLAKPFIWPLSVIIRRSGVQGTTDYLSTEKKLIRMFCFQIFSAGLHGLFAVAALITIAFSIK